MAPDPQFQTDAVTVQLHVEMVSASTLDDNEELLTDLLCQSYTTLSAQNS